MTGRDRPRDTPGAQHPDLQQLTRDWITLWQSELAAAAIDRETQEGWQALLALWANAAAALLPGLRPPHESGRAGAAAAPRPASPDAASDARDAEVDRLARRVRELERRLADLERGGG